MNDAVEFDEVEERLRALLLTVDPEQTTTKDLFRALENDYGRAVKKFKKQIRNAIEEFFDEQTLNEAKPKTKPNPKTPPDSFSLELTSTVMLEIVKTGKTRVVEIHSKPDTITFSRKDFLLISKGIRGAEWEDLSQIEAVEVKLSSKKTVVLSPQGEGLTVTVTEEGLLLYIDPLALMELQSQLSLILEQLSPQTAQQKPKPETKPALVKRQRPTAKEETEEPPVKAKKGTLPGDHLYSLEVDNNLFLSVSEFKGRKRADLRKYYIVKASGELKPTQKGLSMDKDQFTVFINSIDALQQAVADKNTDFFVEISSHRRAAVSDFTGRCLVDLREYYQPKEGGELKPGKKGISFDAKLLEIISNEAKDVMEIM